MKRLLVLCTHNSARSQMAEGWLNYFARRRFPDVEIWSAGTEQTSLNPNSERLIV
jgi:arsenate reductase